MRKVRTALVACIALSLFSVAVAVGAAPAQRFAAIEGMIEDSMASDGVPGVSVAIIDDYDVVYARGFGSAEPGRPVTTATLFQAASLTKPMSAVVAAAAAQEGLIDLGTDVAGMLTSWQLPSTGYDQSITLRMLFAHRAGINVHGFPGYRLDEELPDLPQILSGVRDKNEPIRVVAEPGATRTYSGGGYLVAQMAIEDQIGVAWETLADSLVLEPLSLVQSTYRILDESNRDRVAIGYRSDGSEVAGGGWHVYPETAAASLWTTPSEYATFVIDVMRSYEDGTGAVLDQNTARMLLDPDFAVGFGVSREQGGIAIGHDGANEGYRCRFLAMPDRGQGVIVMTNSDAGDALTSTVVDAVANEFSWPWTGWSTPFWAVALAFLGLIGLLVLVGRFAVMRRMPRTG
jgi:CubicO group peptidase (beta-lactamase class C family)